MYDKYGDGETGPAKIDDFFKVVTADDEAYPMEVQKKIVLRDGQV